MKFQGMPGMGPAFWGWRLFLLFLGINFTVAVAALLNGDYDNIGLPARMQPMELVNNAIEAVLWLAVLLDSLRSRPRFGPELAVFLGGFFWFDVLTTHPLVMPIPPGFLWWGSAAVLIMLIAAQRMAMRRIYASKLTDDASTSTKQTGSHGRALLFLLAVGLGFAGTVASLMHGDYAQSGLPGSVLPWHTVANAIEAAFWLGSAWLVWAGSLRAAGWLGLFASGMFAWDMLSTAFLLNMPLPGQPVWGPIALVCMLGVAAHLRRTSPTRKTP